jgi:hypothetical protein
MSSASRTSNCAISFSKSLENNVLGNGSFLRFAIAQPSGSR